MPEGILSILVSHWCFKIHIKQIVKVSAVQFYKKNQAKIFKGLLLIEGKHEGAESNYQLIYIRSLGLNEDKFFSKFTLEAHCCHHQMLSRAASARDDSQSGCKNQGIRNNTAKNNNWRLSLAMMMSQEKKKNYFSEVDLSKSKNSEGLEKNPRTLLQWKNYTCLDLKKQAY